MKRKILTSLITPVVVVILSTGIAGAQSAGHRAQGSGFRAQG